MIGPKLTAKLMLSSMSRSSTPLTVTVCRLFQLVGVKINVEKQEEILGSFVGEFQDENLDNVLRVMGNALGFNYRIENKVVHIKPSKYD